MAASCRACGAENPTDARFCHECGASLASDSGPGSPGASAAPLAGAQVSCPRCMRVNEPGSTFCYNCGLPLAGVAVGSPIAVQKRGEFWPRVGAHLIDLVLLGLLVSLLVSLAVDGAGAGLLPTLSELAYFTLAVAIWGQAIGKKALGLKVVRPDGSSVGFWRALARAFAYWLSGVILLIGYLMVAFRKDRRALHDLICDTVVIRVRN